MSYVNVGTRGNVIVIFAAHACIGSLVRQTQLVMQETDVAGLEDPREKNNETHNR